MRMNLLLKKLHLENREFTTSAELKGYCRSMEIDCETAIRYLAARGHLVRIFRGIFYVKSLEEVELGRSRYDHLGLVARGLELKKVRKWYFGLHTALKLNNMTHEHFTVEDVVSDVLFRAAPISIAGYRFKFYKLSPSLLDFGVERKNAAVRYSDPEKTVLDFIYIWRYNGMPEDKIIVDIAEWAGNASEEKLMSYAEKYPKSVMRVAERVIA